MTVSEYHASLNEQWPRVKPVENARQIMRMITEHPTLTLTQVAAGLKVRNPVQAVLKVLALKNRMSPEVQSAAESGSYTLAQTYLISKLPFEHQWEFYDKVREQPLERMVVVIFEKLKQLRKLQNLSTNSPRGS